jgi:hypothetical protein
MLPLELIAVLVLVFAFVLFAMIRHAYGTARAQERTDVRPEIRTDQQEEVRS